VDGVDHRKRRFANATLALPVTPTATIAIDSAEGVRLSLQGTTSNPNTVSRGRNQQHLRNREAGNLTLHRFTRLSGTTALLAFTAAFVTFVAIAALACVIFCLATTLRTDRRTNGAQAAVRTTPVQST